MGTDSNSEIQLSPPLRRGYAKSYPHQEEKQSLLDAEGADGGLPPLDAAHLPTENGTKESPFEGHVTGRLLMSLLVSLFGSFQFGWHTGVVNLVKSTIEDDLNIGNIEWGLIVAIFSIGGAVGAGATPRAIDKFGRKLMLSINGIFFVVAGALQFVAGDIRHEIQNSLIILIVSRIIAGLGCGAATVGVPMYLGEISSRNIRGLFGSLNNFATVCAIFLSQAISAGLNSSSDWKWLFAIAGILGLVQMALGTWILESPKWLASQGRTDEAKEVLKKSRGYLEDDADAELEEIREHGGEGLDDEVPSVWKVVNSRSLRRPLVAAVLLTVTQQLSGIDSVFYYSSYFFETAGASPTAGTLLASATNVISMGIGVQLMERAGRRLLLLTGMFGMGSSAALISLAMIINKHEHSFDTGMGVIIIIFVLSFVSFFQIGLGSIPWQIGGEIFPDAPRATAMSIAAAGNWIASAIVAFAFPKMNQHLKEYTYLPFAAILLLAWLYTFYWVPGTKGRTLLQIQDAFHGRAPLAVPKVQRQSRTFPLADDETPNGGQFSSLEHDAAYTHYDSAELRQRTF
eukprot:gb/GECG01000439.1/.p1 GENE.gb/GECG01000439.1/~~gb/GECG01000439.1/.p1  ORF type:complete len:571 (+),score=58.75 gb/GECG01000439.1/:1-1713(+)